MAENDEKVEVEDEIANPPEVAEGEEDLTDYKALAAKNAGIAQRYKTKFEKSKIVREVEKGVAKELEKKVEKTEFDYGEMAYLEAKGVSEEDHDYLFQEAQMTGKSLKNLLGFKYVQEELASRKQGRETKESLPTGGKRSTSSQRDSVDYWLAKIDQGKATVLDISDRKLRQEVLQARIKREESASQFTDTPLIAR